MSIRKSSKDKHGVKVKDQRRTLTEDGRVRLREKGKRRAQDVIHEIASGNSIPDGAWEQQIGLIFENRIRKGTDKDGHVIYLGLKQRKTLLKISLEWMNDYYERHYGTQLPPPEKYKAFLYSPLFSRKELSRGK